MSPIFCGVLFFCFCSFDAFFSFLCVVVVFLVIATAAAAAAAVFVVAVIVSNSSMIEHFFILFKTGCFPELNDNIWLWLVWVVFYGIPIIVGYFMQNALYTYISKDSLISDYLLSTPAHGHAPFGRSTKTYITSIRTQDTN